MSHEHWFFERWSFELRSFEHWSFEHWSFERWREALLRVWRWGLAPKSPAAFGFAIACFATASGIHLLFRLIRPDLAAYSTYYPAILFATLVGGVWSGAIVLVLGGAMAWFVFEPSFLVVPPPLSDEVTSFLLYLLSATFIIWGAEHYRLVVRRVDEEEHYRRLVVGELGHRIKNKFATVYAVLGHELQSNAELWPRISGRLRALSTADEFIFRSDGAGAVINDLLVAELTPYDLDRIALEGEALFLPSKLAVTLALIFHELATNAAKYGALSVSTGRVRISWTLAAARQLKICWTETGGPKVVEQKRRGFGSKLFRHALDPFHGKVDPRHEPGGVTCSISCCVPEDPEGTDVAAAPARRSLVSRFHTW
jgi:two-component sensor histidine kinase